MIRQVKVRTKAKVKVEMKEQVKLRTKAKFKVAKKILLSTLERSLSFLNLNLNLLYPFPVFPEERLEA